ncbi:MAG: hypothetical protein OXR73_04945 [Myxococcales bacterium]|nr:hypothetical protein [Myxococcales bacterium]
MTGADESHPSTSGAQLAAEAQIRTALARKLNLVFEAQPRALDGLRLDAYSPGPPHVLVEIFARIGRSKPGQVKKLSRDMAKLLLAEHRLAGEPCRKVIAVMDRAAVAHFERGWDGEFARTFDIETVVVAVDQSVHGAVAAAQRRQYR